MSHEDHFINLKKKNDIYTEVDNENNTDNNHYENNDNVHNNTKITTTNFDILETHKENIIPLRQGRSASQLAATFNYENNENANNNKEIILQKIRSDFELRIHRDLESMDDPLQLYLDYINWINESYPEGVKSKNSGMLDVLEQCLSFFQDWEIYSNDPRFIKLWIWYIEIFYCIRKNSYDLEGKLNTFMFMKRHSLGTKLAFFYENYATVLWDIGNFKEALDILQQGIDLKAIPISRLKKNYQAFSENFQKILDRPSTANSRNNGLHILGQDRENVIKRREAPVTSITNNQEISNKTSSIYRDDGTNNFTTNTPLKNWNVFEKRENQNKENQLKKESLVHGKKIEPLQQVALSDNCDIPTVSTSNVLNRLEGKIPIFDDKLNSYQPVYKILDVPGKKMERIDCNYNLLYSNASGNKEEFCLEEILAISRNCYTKNSDEEKEETLLLISSSLDSNTKINDENMSQRDDKKRMHDSELKIENNSFLITNKKKKKGNNALKEKKIPLTEYKQITHTSTLPLKGSSGSNNNNNNNNNNIQFTQEDPTFHMNLKPSTPPETHNAKNNYIQKSPTITMFSKNAMNEVYSMFNQSVGGNQKEQLLYPGYDTSVSTNMNGIEDNNTERRFEMYENFTQDLTRKTMDDLTEVKVIDPIIKKTTGSQDASKSLKQISKGSKLKTFMTPIDNKNILENFKGINDIENRKTPTAAAASSYATNIIEDPLNESFRKHLLNEAKLKNLPNFYQYEQDLKMSQVLKRIHSKSKKLANKNPIVNFQKTNELYCIRSELGKGGYAVVYLAESSNGSLKALKVQKPASEWEFYILKQIENRLSAKDFILNSIIYVDSLHCFRDESYLVLNYISQGTLLDLINIHKTERGESCLNELLCMFFTIELLKVLESLHDVGIIHGDLKPDNCMVRFIKVAGDILGDYNSNNQNGWQNKGIYLIDFGRSFDLSLFPMGTKFKANWKCDQQDCIEMRTGTPWSYEADYYGLAGIIHSMLFGEFIETIEIAGSQNNNTGFYKLKNGFKRYWQKQLWEPLFDLLLNSGKKELPRTSELMQCRQNMENFLTDKENGNKLKSIILGLEPDLVYKLKSD